MKKNVLRIVSALAILALLALVFTIGVSYQNAHATSLSNKPASVFALEHRHGVTKANAPDGAFSYTCSGAVNGNRVINVTEKVTGDADSGQAGNYWGIDTFTRTIQVWNTGDDSYCAVVAYKGKFAAQAGQKSPGTTQNTGGILTGDEGGTMNGEAQIYITGPLNVSNPSIWPLSGQVNGGNVVDYGCTINPDGTDQCTNYVDWVAQYFDESAPSYTLSEPNWGWKYVGRDQPPAPDKGASDGVWVNASTGNSGDILDVD